MVFKGTAVAQGTGRAMVTATGMATEMGSIADMLEATQEEPTPLQTEVGRIGRMLGIAVIIIAVVVVVTVFVISDVRTATDAVTVLLLGVSLAVAAVPEGLPAILSVVLALGVQRMATHRAIVKTAVLGGDARLCLGHLLGQDRHTHPARDDDPARDDCLRRGRGHRSRIHARRAGRARRRRADRVGPGSTRHRWCSAAGAWPATPICGNDDGEWQIQGDPTEAAFLVAERKLGGTERRARRFKRVARDSVHLRAQADVHRSRKTRAGDSLVLITKGAQTCC